MNEIQKNKEMGITLIALVVTIIVLLILAGISITLVLGENGIIHRTKDAKKIHEEKNIDTEIEMASGAALIAGNGIISYDNLIMELDRTFGENGYDITPKSESESWIITVENVEKTVYSGKVPEGPPIREALQLNLTAENVEERSSYVNYRYEGLSEPILCKVLYNSTGERIEIVSLDTLKKITLGAGSTSGKIGAGGEAEKSWRAAVGTLNEEAEKFINTNEAIKTIVDARVVGTKRENKNQNANGSTTDTNYTEDVERLSAIGTIVANDGKPYWLGSRLISFGGNGVKLQKIRIINNIGNLGALELTGGDQSDWVSGYALGYLAECNLRVIFSIGDNTIISRGKGTLAEPYELSVK